MLNFITGGVCAAQGFRAGGIHVGVKTHAAWKKDVALIVSDEDCACAAVYTKNAVKAAHIHVDKRHLAYGKARAAVINSGNANACAPMGEENAERVCAAAGKALGCRPEDVVVAATGVIGQTLNVAVIEQGMPELCAAAAHTAAGSDAAAHAIMTTDTVKKELAVETVIGGKTVRMGGIAKGSGMIHPNMGTMLCFLTTDCAISSEMIKSALLETVQVSFNRISVDGDTSTNDTCCVLANGLAGNPVITEKGPDYDAFVEALRALCVELAKKMASDGEGATHLITCTVTGAGSEQSAETVAKSVIGSALTKAAIFGADANWGRVLCAMGYSGEDFNPDKVDVAFQSQAGSVQVCAKGRGLDFDEDLAKRVLTEHDVTIAITMGEGDSSCTCWGCDLTYEYVKINGDYRTETGMPDSALAGSGDGPLSGGLSAPRSGCICPVIIAAIPASHGTPPPPPAESRRFSRKELMLRCPPTHSRRGRLWKPCPISRNSPARPSWSSTAATPWCPTNSAGLSCATSSCCPWLAFGWWWSTAAGRRSARC